MLLDREFIPVKVRGLKAGEQGFSSFAGKMVCSGSRLDSPRCIPWITFEKRNVALDLGLFPFSLVYIRCVFLLTMFFFWSPVFEKGISVYG